MTGLKQNPGTLLAAGAALLLGLLLLAAALVTLTEREASFADGSAEAVVQQYEVAIAGGDLNAAYVLLADELRQACPLEQNLPTYVGDREGERVTLKGSEMIGETLIVTVRVTDSEFEGPLRGRPALVRTPLHAGRGRRRVAVQRIPGAVLQVPGAGSAARGVLTGAGTRWEQSR